jgi:hypothetical protein
MGIMGKMQGVNASNNPAPKKKEIISQKLPVANKSAICESEVGLLAGAIAEVLTTTGGATADVIATAGGVMAETAGSIRATGDTISGKVSVNTFSIGG